MKNYQVLQRGGDGTAAGLATGGPYVVDGAHDVFVGDLWVLAGQSNMEGVGDLVDVDSPSAGVHSFQSCERWAVAEEPLHWLGESPRVVHHRLWGAEGLPETIPPRDPGRTKGAGLGLAFGKAYYGATGVPVGLIPSAHGGTSMDQWDPALKNEGGASLYGATLERIKANGGRIKGILWYQGESDATPSGVPVYEEKMRRLVSAFRADLNAPDLPFFFVQIGRFIIPDSADMVDGWNGVREAERRLARAITGAGMASAIDLDLDDGIHISTDGLKRLGRRLAALAMGSPTLDLKGLEWIDRTRLRVAFDGVRGDLRSAGRPSGFEVRDVAGNLARPFFKTTLEGDSVILHVSDGLGAAPCGLSLWYGCGLDPYCNITDAADMAAPAFGPVTIPEPPM